MKRIVKPDINYPCFKSKQTLLFDKLTWSVAAKLSLEEIIIIQRNSLQRERTGYIGEGEKVFRTATHYKFPAKCAYRYSIYSFLLIPTHSSAPALAWRQTLFAPALSSEKWHSRLRAANWYTTRLLSSVDGVLPSWRCGQQRHHFCHRW